VCVCARALQSRDSDAPTIVERPTADRVIKGQNTTLRCRADANPPVTYEWFRVSADFMTGELFFDDSRYNS
jgi:hypothetical protein